MTFLKNKWKWNAKWQKKRGGRWEVNNNYNKPAWIGGEDLSLVAVHKVCDCLSNLELLRSVHLLREAILFFLVATWWKENLGWNCEPALQTKVVGGGGGGGSVVSLFLLLICFVKKEKA